MRYVGHEREAFLKLTTAQLLGASLDLWLELIGNDPEPLKRFVTMRLQATMRAIQVQKFRKCTDMRLVFAADSAIHNTNNCRRWRVAKTAQSALPMASEGLIHIVINGGLSYAQY